MGHFATHLRSFSTIALKHFPNRAEMPEICWAHINRKQEASSGGDFAVVVDHSNGGEPDPVLKIVLFQAKVAHRPPFISIDHRTNETKGPLSWTASASGLMRALAQQAKGSLNKAQCAKVAEWLSYPMKHERYQLEALLRTHFRGQLLTNQQRKWNFYSVWRPDVLPQVVNLHDVAKPMEC